MQFSSFAEFYPFYLREHSDPRCRRCHFWGSTLVILTLLWLVTSGNWAYWWLLPVFGYGLAWYGHFRFEKNKPATFKHPLYSFIGDWVMYKDMWMGKLD